MQGGGADSFIRSFAHVRWQSKGARLSIDNLDTSILQNPPVLPFHMIEFNLDAIREHLQVMASYQAVSRNARTRRS